MGELSSVFHQHGFNECENSQFGLFKEFIQFIALFSQNKLIFQCFLRKTKEQIGKKQSKTSVYKRNIRRKLRKTILPESPFIKVLSRTPTTLLNLGSYRSDSWFSNLPEHLFLKKLYKSASVLCMGSALLCHTKMLHHQLS